VPSTGSVNSGEMVKQNRPVRFAGPEHKGMIDEIHQPLSSSFAGGFD